MRGPTNPYATHITLSLSRKTLSVELSAFCVVCSPPNTRLILLENLLNDFLDTAREAWAGEEHKSQAKPGTQTTLLACSFSACSPAERIQLTTTSVWGKTQLSSGSSSEQSTAAREQNSMNGALLLAWCEVRNKIT